MRREINTTLERYIHFNAKATNANSSLLVPLVFTLVNPKLLAT